MLTIILCCVALGLFIFGYLTYTGKIKDKPETLLKMLSIKKEDMKYIDFDSIERIMGVLFMANAGIVGLMIVGNYIEHKLLSYNFLFIVFVVVDFYFMGVLEKPLRFIKKEMLMKEDEDNSGG